MIRTLLHFLLSVFIHSSFAQTKTWHSVDNLPVELKHESEAIKFNNLKSHKVYSSKKDNNNRKKLMLTETYDSNGNITCKIDHHYYRYKDHDKVNYSYDNEGRIKKITDSTSFSDGFVHYIFFNYTDNKVSSIVKAFDKTENTKFDTSYFSYFPDGRKKTKTETRYNRTAQSYYSLGTLYYHYNQYGDIYVDHESRDTIFGAMTIKDKNGCVIGYTDTINDGKYTMVCDSLCNVIYYNWELRGENNWVYIDRVESKYVGTNQVELKSYECPRNILSRCSGKLKLKYWIKYEYDNRGLLSKETYYNKRGRKVEIKKHIYETYSD